MTGELKNYYEILGISKDASDNEVLDKIKEQRKIWRNRTNNPDHERRAEAERQMAWLGEAERIFSDAAKRREYDAQLQDSEKRDKKENQDSGRRNSDSYSQLEDADDFYNDAVNYFNSGNIKMAYFAIQDSLRLNSKSSDAWLLRAKIAQRLNRLDDAEYSASQAAKLDIQNLELYDILSDISIDKGDINKAINFLSEASRVSRKRNDNVSADYYFCQANHVIIEHSNNPDQIKDALKKIEDVYNKDVKSQINLCAYISAIITSAYNLCSHDSSGSCYPTNKAQVDYLLSAFTKAEELNKKYEEPSIFNEAIETLGIYAKDSNSRVFNGIGSSWIVVFIGLSITMTSLERGFLGVIIAILALVFTFKVARAIAFPLQYKLNADYIGQWAKTGLQN